MSTNAQKGCGRGENKYVKEIHFLHNIVFSVVLINFINSKLNVPQYTSKIKPENK